MSAEFSFAAQSWSVPREVNTGAGPRFLRKIALTHESPAAGNFWKVWREQKDAVKAIRFSAGRDRETNAWEACHWEADPGQFDQDVANLDALLRGEEIAEAQAKLEQEVAYVPESYPELKCRQSELLYEWQRPSCQRVVAALQTGNALDASQTGSGKTAVALTACAELGLTPYVIAPLAVLEAWRREARRVGVTLGGVTNYDKARAGSVNWMRRDEVQGPPTKSGRPGKREHKFTFCPPPSRDLFSDEKSRAVLILDEVQKCKARDTVQSRILSDCAASGVKIHCLSATAAKDPTEMYGIGMALGLHRGGNSYFEWAKAHGCKTGTYGLRFTDKPAIAAEVMSRIHRKVFPARGTRIRSADVPGYPDNHVTAHLVENPDIADAYDKMAEELELIEEKIEAGKMEKAAGAAADLAAMMKARRASEKGKLDFFIEETKELLADGFQVAIFLNFREHLAIVRDALKMTSQPVWGTAWVGKQTVLDAQGFAKEIDMNGPSQKPEERQRIIDDFQSGKQRVILVSLQAGGAGISLHDLNGVPRQSLISPSYSAIDLVQALGRIWRAGSLSKATQRVVMAAGTIEEEIAASIQAKIANIETLCDGDLMADSVAAVIERRGIQIKEAA